MRSDKVSELPAERSKKTGHDEGDFQSVRWEASHSR